MKNKTISKILFAVFAVALCAAAYFAADLAFFQYDDPLERASLSIMNDGEDLSFTYENDAITLHSGNGTTVYALTTDGTAVVNDGLSEYRRDAGFDRFYRVDESRSKEENSGFGIGLSIARAITEKHGGTIKANVNENGRLQITCVLPQRNK